VAASRSGTTTETLRAARLLARRRTPVVALTCAARSPLAAAADITLASPQGRERSVVMTKSFSSMLLNGLTMAASLGGDAALARELRRLPALGRRALKAAVPLTRDLGAEASWFVFLGAGPSQGIAWEGMLKLTEMAQRKAVAYHPLEYRHGPIALAGPGTLAVLLGTDSGAGLEKTLVRDLGKFGTHVVALSGSDARRTGAEIEVSLADGLSDAARAVLYLPFAQLLAYHRAVGAGLDPDRPHHLTAVVRL
jgi:glucosamine--fructose-6-phosphate aminotransferase (isomerizing)